MPRDQTPSTHFLPRASFSKRFEASRGNRPASNAFDRTSSLLKRLILITVQVFGKMRIFEVPVDLFIGDVW